MAAIILDRQLEKALVRKRRETGPGRFDEVWDGVYVMSPIANNEHQFRGFQWTSVIDQALSARTGDVKQTDDARRWSI